MQAIFLGKFEEKSFITQSQIYASIEICYWLIIFAKSMITGKKWFHSIYIYNHKCIVAWTKMNGTHSQETPRMSNNSQIYSSLYSYTNLFKELRNDFVIQNVSIFRNDFSCTICRRHLEEEKSCRHLSGN